MPSTPIRALHLVRPIRSLPKRYLQSGVAFDLGGQYRISKIYGIGLTILNINSPNMALSPSDTDKVSSVYKVGLARRTQISGGGCRSLAAPIHHERVPPEYGRRTLDESGFGIRGGIGFGQRQYQITTIGFSYRWENLQFDYALIYPLTGIKGTFGTNQLSMTFRFGRRN